MLVRSLLLIICLLPAYSFSASLQGTLTDQDRLATDSFGSFHYDFFTLTNNNDATAPIIRAVCKRSR